MKYSGVLTEIQNYLIKSSRDSDLGIQAGSEFNGLLPQLLHKRQDLDAGVRGHGLYSYAIGD